jgi:hypothetical protein
MTTTTRKYTPIGRPVAPSDRAWADALTQRLGPAGAAGVIGVTRATLAAILAGLPVAASTDDRLWTARANHAAA